MAQRGQEQIAILCCLGQLAGILPGAGRPDDCAEAAAASVRTRMISSLECFAVHARDASSRAMHSISVALIALGVVFGGFLIGTAIGARLPPHHLSKQTKDTIKLGMGMIATLSGLVLGLLVATAKGSFDTTDSEVKQTVSKFVVLDRVLARYGPETDPARAELRAFLARKIDQIWAGHRALVPRIDDNALERIQNQLDVLSPSGDRQRQLKDRALALAGELSQNRWLLITQSVGSSLPTPFLVIVLFWLTILFMSFGLFASPNATVIAAMLVCALSVATALLLVMEMDRPLSGLVRISDAPARHALQQLGR
jgi:hypothetical protein